jgi:hypothetical protein
MGIYLNPGSGKFREALNSQIYVDKTGLASYTNQVIGSKQKFVCVSRPRRFGKSMGTEMLAAYYGRGEDSAELFAPFEIAADPSFAQHLNKYDAIAINMIDMMALAKDVREINGNKEISFLDKLAYKIASFVGGEVIEAYPKAKYKDIEHIQVILDDAFQHSNIPFVVIIDEWDCIFREQKDNKLAQEDYIAFLRLLFKDKAYLALAYMTGILPIKKYGTHSVLNMFSEFSMTSQKDLARFTGFTQDEVDPLCVRFEMSRDETAAWYNGYILQDRHERYAVYSPRSVVEGMLHGEFAGYWIQTETWEALRDYIVLDYDGLQDTITKLLAGEHVAVGVEKFENDMVTFKKADDVLSLLIHLGYLGYDRSEGTAFIPNREIQKEFVNAMEDECWPEVIKAVQASKQLLKDTWALDTAAIAAGIESAHLETAHITYNSEEALSYTLSLAYFAAREYYITIRELPTGKGFADLAFIPRPFHPDKPALLLELKWDKDADTAITQIHNKQYPDALRTWAKAQGGPGLTLLGISYDKQTREHSCVIETV